MDILNRVIPITEREYLDGIKDGVFNNVLKTLENELSKTYKDFSIETPITQLCELTGIKKRMSDIINKRIENAPFKSKVLELNIKELKDSLVVQEMKDGLANQENNELNIARNKGYEMVAKGMNPLFKRFGYFFIFKIVNSVGQLGYTLHPIPLGWEIPIFNSLVEGASLAFLLPELEKKLSNELINESKEPEPLPEYEFKSEAEKIAWLFELGVLKTILNKCTIGESINWRRAANIISSFTDIHPETIRKSLMAIYHPNDGNKKNNPFGNSSNKIFVEEMKTKFKLNKETLTK